MVDHYPYSNRPYLLYILTAYFYEKVFLLLLLIFGFDKLATILFISLLL